MYPIETVPFHGDSLITLSVNDQRYVALKPIVLALGMSWGSQRNKLSSERCIDNDTPSRYSIISTPCQTSSGIQEMLCIPLRKLNGWLFSINPNKVRKDLRAKVICYQDECFEVLYRYWNRPKNTFPENEISPFDKLNPKTMAELRRVNPRLVQAYLVDQGVTPQLVEKLLSGRNLTPELAGRCIMPLGKLRERAIDKVREHDPDCVFLYVDQFESIIRGYDKLATLRHLRDTGLLFCDSDRLTRKMNQLSANRHCKGVRKNVYILSKAIFSEEVQS
ncbi:phage antirepressor N-terminal domain-containing protein [Endozoicomonas gorgoniicola]|uniref:Phage antirepressor N-terminal domain-containing protein n=1 Tax=Endozoicomonas gorgoniicola TaxID=1234144 RepID=A0ABT3N1L0_9GAMM|nr:phage antirepressor N-terminal domain-containing protein [Endozoicomonas gorgoniicola]MCW7555517.1 phage antirepressor N-terminal domain-containing protein [Endozoicomonas gorgoniicola]